MKKYTGLIIAVIVLGGSAYYTQQLFIESSFPAPETTSVENTSTSPQEESEGSQEISAAARGPERAPTATRIASSAAETRVFPLVTFYTIPVLADGSVLNAMYALTAASDFSFSGRNFPTLGSFIEEIGGLKNEGGFYWTLFINNGLSEKGATGAEVSPGDIIEWRYQRGI